MLWLGVSSTDEDHRVFRFARVLMALRRALPKLQGYYETIDAANIPAADARRPHPRFYPDSRSFVEQGNRVHFDYVQALENHPTCVTYLAKVRREGFQEFVVVKFANRYGREVHQFLATKGYAPRLRYCGPMDGNGFQSNNSLPGTASPPCPLSSDVNMVVMDYVENTDKRPTNAREQLEKILTELHAEGYALGDLREPNVLFEERGQVKLIDFDWAGRYDMKIKDSWLPSGLQQKILDNVDRVQGSTKTQFVLYPCMLSAAISWPEGARVNLPIRPQHDWLMLKQLLA